MKQPLTIRIKHSLWSVVGTCTLMGLYAEAMLANQDRDEKTLVLEIEQTSFEYRKARGGPEEIIVPEFMPPCLIEDVLTLSRRGVDIHVRTVDTNSPEL